MGQVLGHGLRAAPAYILGILAGDLIWFATAALGIATLAQACTGLFTVIKWVGVAYLLYLAWKMWVAPVSAIPTEASSRDVANGQLFASGLTLTLGNPKAVAFFVALLPSIINLEDMTAAGFSEVALVIVIILPAVLISNACFAHAARGFFRSPPALRALNRISGTAIAGAAIDIAARN